MNDRLIRGKCIENEINPKAVYEFFKATENRDLGLDSFMIIKSGVVVAEGYHNPYTSTKKHVLYSMSKSITSLALGYAVSEGKISLDDSICKFFPQYDKFGINKKITVRSLASMTSGKMIGMAENRHNKDWIKIFFDAPIISNPGTKFSYINDNFYMISAIISKVYGETLVDFLYPRLFAKLGIDKPLWETDKFGYAAGGWGLYMPIEDIAKITVCLSKMGVYNNEQVIPADWIKQATAYRVDTVKKGQIDVTKGYGYGFWRISIENAYRAYGLHGQMAYVFEDKDTVLIANCGISKDEYISDEINKMCKTLWDSGSAEDEEKLYALLNSLGDKDNLPAMPRNEYLENKYSCHALKTKSTTFASMLNATISTMLNETIGYIDTFSISLDSKNNLYMLWKESTDVNKIRLGMNNRYEKTDVVIGGLHLTAYAKAAWCEANKLTVLVRIGEVCHVRKLVFDFSDEKHIVIHNNSHPNLPELAAHYMDFIGMPLSPKLEKFLIKYVAPAILLIGEPDFYIR